MEEERKVDVVVIGAGISGIVTAKCLLEAGLSVVVLERTGEVGGLWTFRENDYGVMRFTHINVSKYNYCFSDFPFPDDTADYVRHDVMANYVNDYVRHFSLAEHIKFMRKVHSVDKIGEKWQVTASEVDENGESVKKLESQEVYHAKFVAIASGHHAKPSYAEFPGQDTFTGNIIHSVKYKDVISNGMVGHRVLIVGIGNSAVDAATNCASVGRCKSVYISTRSGAWVVPNYIFGFPTDLYATRFFFLWPWKVGNFVFENVIKLISGNPNKWDLRPKMKALQTQPTVSPTLIHHIQRKEIKIVPNVQKIDGSTVTFMNGETAEFDDIILCTGYKIDLPFLSQPIRNKVLDSEKNSIKLYKNVFNPDIGSSLAFIGFVQPASGGILTMSECQARWFAELCKGRLTLPNKHEMLEDITKEQRYSGEKYHASARHTLQKDPIPYNDDITAMFGAKPSIWKHPDLAWRLLFGSCGAYQWRLQGPNRWAGAKKAVKKVPIPDFWNLIGYSVVLAIFLVLYWIYSCIF